MDTKSLERYINKVVEEACAAEGRKNDVRYEYKIIENILVFAIKSQYIRVRRRIEYRLMRNLKKNFGLEFNLVYPNPMHEGVEGLWEGAIIDTFPWSQGVDPNNSFMRIIIFGKQYTLRSVYGIYEHEEEYNAVPYLNELKKHGYDYEQNQSWSVFEDAFKQAFNKTPYDGFLEMLKKYRDT